METKYKYYSLSQFKLFAVSVLIIYYGTALLAYSRNFNDNNVMFVILTCHLYFFYNNWSCVTEFIHILAVNSHYCFTFLLFLHESRCR